MEIKTWKERREGASYTKADWPALMQDEINELRAALVERVPLSREQVATVVDSAGYVEPQERADFINGMRHCEIAHNIKES